MKKLFNILLLLFITTSVAAQCPVSIDCDNNTITMEYLSVPSTSLDSMQVNVQGKGPHTLYVDSIVGNYVYLSKGVLSCSDIIVVTNYYDSTGKIKSKCTQNYALPVTLLYFRYKTAGPTIILSWATAQEINCGAFDVEKSIDAKHWFTIGRVSGHGNTNSVTNYSFIDEINQTTYYRLQQVDYNGDFEYFGPIAIPLSSEMPERIFFINTKGYETTSDDKDAIIVIQYNDGTVIKKKRLY